jgi:hypothetical protein
MAKLEGGSSGLGGLPFAQGLAGGAVEIGALGTLNVTGIVKANAADALSGNPGAGGASGGGILLDANSVNLSGTLEALGGHGAGSMVGFPPHLPGGDGGGGRIAVVYDPATGSYLNTANIELGNGNFLLAVPEPHPFSLMAIFLVVGCGGALWRKARAPVRASL